MTWIKPSGASRVRLSVTNTLIAARLGATKETLSWLLRTGRLRPDPVDKREIMLRDRQRLAQIARPAAHRPLSDTPA